MSYDLRVWSALRPDLPNVLPAGSWSDSGARWMCNGRGWNLVVERPLPVDMEDIPDEVNRSLPGLAFLTEIHLEPMSAPESARKLAIKVADAIARPAHGSVLDEQEGALTVPRGVTRYRAEPGNAVELLTFSWWWLGDQLATVEGLSRFVHLLAEHVPEALPRRYGSYEPPEFKFAEQGHDHLVRFLHEQATDFVVMYPTLPALGLTLNLQDHTGHGPHGFVAHHLQVDFDRSALAQPGWAAGLSRFWRAMSFLLEPFYGDVRTLIGYERRGSRLWVPMDAENHPVDGPFWAGLPAGPAHALVLGNPYTSLWSVSTDAERSEGELKFEAVEDWSGGDDVFELVGPPPAELADPLRVSQGDSGSFPLRATHQYPDVWPFDA